MTGRGIIAGWMILLSLRWSASLMAGDWPFIQGPTFNGRAEDERLFPEWGADGPAVLWTRELGQGYSSFVVAGNRCLTQYQSPLGQFVICLEAGSGRTLWEHRYALPYEALGLYPGPRSTPTISGNRVLFAAPDGALGCLDLQTGDQLWTSNPKQKFSGQGTDFGYAASPVVVEELVILPIGGAGASIVALRIETGEVAWTSGNDSASYCPALPITLGGRNLVVNYLENSLVIHDLQGHELARQSLSLGYDEHSAVPLYQEPMLIVSAPFRAGATAYELRWIENEQAAPRVEFQTRWQSTEFSNDVVTSVISEGVLCGFDLRDPQSRLHRPSRGTYRGLDPNTGRTLWSHEEVGQAGAVAARNKLVLFSDKGEVLLAQASREGLAILSRASVFPDEVCWTRPALSSGRLFLRTHSRAVCLRVGESSVASADVAESTQRLEDVRSAPGVAWDWLLAGEREHPFVRIEGEEAVQWYLASLWACVLPSWLFATLIPAARGSRRLGVMLGSLFITGVVMTPLLNSRMESFQFTWPVAVYAAFQGAVLASLGMTQNPANRRGRVLSRIAGLAFIAACLAYYQALKTLGEPMEWVFLLGPIPSTPVVVLVARSALRNASWWRVSGEVLLAFTTSYWGALGLQWLRSLIVEQI